MMKLLPLLALMAALALTGCDRSRSNTSPTANAGPHQTVNENTPVSLSGSGADAEDTVQYSWTQTSGTTVTLSGADTENASFTAPEVDEDEDLVFQLTVTDTDGAWATDTVTVTIANVPNVPPTADAGSDQTVDEAMPVSLSGSGTDAEGAVWYNWAQTSGTTVMLSGADTENASFTAPEVDVDEDLVFELTVTDADGASAADTVTVTILRSEVTYTITTIAGSGAEDDEGSLATEAFLTSPRGVAVDDHGNVYIADTENHRVRKVDAESGIITTIAGTGEEGYGGDEGPAAEAKLNWPTGVAVDDAGNVYVADRNNERVRRVDPEGIITTFAGTGEWGYDSDEDGGPATEALLNWPADVALDGDGNLYIADEYNNRIRKVDAGGTITTVAGMRRPTLEVGEEEEEDEDDHVGDHGPATSALLNRPSGVALDEEGNLYIADRNHNRIRKVNAEGVITTIAGMADEGFSGDEGPAASAQLYGPSGVAVDEGGYVFIADTGNNRIRQIDPDGVITTLAGSEGGGDGSAMEGHLAAPRDVAVDSDGNLYVADTGNHQIHVIDDTGMVTRVAGIEGLGDGGPATEARLLEPAGLALVDGTIYITDTGNNRIRRVDANGIITTFAGSGERGDAGDDGPALEAQFNGPSLIAVDAAGNVYISDRLNHRVRKVDTNGIITNFAGSGESGPFEDQTDIGDGGPATEARLILPTGLAFDAADNLYVTDPGNHRIRKVSTQGRITTLAGSGERSFSGDEGPAAEAQLSTPVGFEIDVHGNFYVSDFAWPRNRIRKIDTAGIITTIAETASFGGLTVDLEGNVYIVESTVGRILKVTPAGVLTVIAGSTQPGYSGDGGPATQAQLDEPKGIEVDEDGNVYFADSENNRIRKLTPNR